MRPKQSIPTLFNFLACDLKHLLLAALLLVYMTAWAGPFEDAYEREDYATALRLLRPLATLGLNSSAQYNIGLMYAKGQGVVQDYAEAVKWYRLAAAQRHASAQNNLGLIYADGHGVVRDYVEAVKWYRLAAAQRNASAQYNLGLMYDNGQGVEQDTAEAVKWYRLAAGQGDETAQNNLGLMYHHGRGVVQDHVRAHMWLDLAAIKGYADAAKNRDMAAKRMTTQQLEEAEKLARECMARNFNGCS